jgi:hydrogenase expression/formation protein HypE
MSCPVDVAAAETIQLAHGGGGRAMNQLIERVFLPAFGNPALLRRHDGAVFDVGGRCAMSTDSCVVQPLFFPGGDIGTLAVYGTVNDLAMCGARPLYLSTAFILEGLLVARLERVVASMRDAAAAARVQIVTGDVKVVDRGKADGLFINVAGVGRIEAPCGIEPQAIRPGDAIVLSGDIGRHGVAVLAARENLGFQPPVVSDCASVADAALALFEEGIEVHCLRDLTRGGLASALVELSQAAGVGIEIEERAIAVSEAVSAACELLGLDPLHVANEGRFIAVVPEHETERVLQRLRGCAVSAGAMCIGRVDAGLRAQVVMKTALGARRVVDMLSGEQLPRIC